MAAGIPRPSALPPEFADALAPRAGRLGGFGARVEWYDTVSSTNDVADRLAWEGAAHGTVVAADFQESGRGRMGRTWHSPPGAGLYVSVVLRPERLLAPGGRAPLSAASPVTLTAGVAAADALRAVTGLPVEIKWPNDVVIGWRKICGILAEGAAAGHAIRHVVLGIGVNVLASAYPPDIADRATSLEAEAGRAVDRGAVFAELLACLAERVGRLPAGRFDEVLEAWRRLSPSSAGTRVGISTPDGWVEAVTAGLDADGALLVHAGGEARRVIAGEVRWPAPGGRLNEDLHAARH